MKRILAIAAVGVTMSVAVPAFADCIRPAEPTDMPDGATATKEEMIAGVKMVHSYQKALADFRSCLDTERAAAEAEAAKNEASDDKAAKKALQELYLTYTRRYNAAVDAEKAFVDRFNEEIRAYKNRTASTK